jgi:hypothetical protein
MCVKPLIIFYKTHIIKFFLFYHNKRYKLDEIHMSKMFKGIYSNSSHNYI